MPCWQACPNRGDAQPGAGLPVHRPSLFYGRQHLGVSPRRTVRPAHQFRCSAPSGSGLRAPWRRSLTSGPLIRRPRRASASLAWLSNAWNPSMRPNSTSVPSLQPSVPGQTQTPLPASTPRARAAHAGRVSTGSGSVAAHAQQSVPDVGPPFAECVESLCA